MNKNAQNINTNILLIQHPLPKEAISHILELPSTEKTISYYHAAAGFPTKETWTDAIWAGNYDPCPGLNVKWINKYFLKVIWHRKGIWRANPKATAPPSQRNLNQPWGHKKKSKSYTLNKQCNQIKQANLLTCQSRVWCTSWLRTTPM